MEEIFIEILLIIIPGMPKGIYKHKLHSLETKKKMSEAKKKNSPKNLFYRGMKRPFMMGNNNPSKKPDVRKKISESKFGKPRPDIAGENSRWWRGGLTPKNHLIRRSLEYRIWRKAVFERDNYTCQWCLIRGAILQADHIKPFALFPELRFAIDNGRTLCIDCHKKTDNYLNKSRWNQK